MEQKEGDIIFPIALNYIYIWLRSVWNVPNQMLGMSWVCKIGHVDTSGIEIWEHCCDLLAPKWAWILWNWHQDSEKKSLCMQQLFEILLH